VVDGTHKWIDRIRRMGHIYLVSLWSVNSVCPVSHIHIGLPDLDKFDRKFVRFGTLSGRTNSEPDKL